MIDMIQRLHVILALTPLVGGFAIGSTVDTTSYDRSDLLLAPPRWMFPVAWTILYILLGYSAYRIGFGNQAIILWWVGLILNFAWTPAWFGANDKDAAKMILQALIVTTLVMALVFYRIDHVAGWLQAPYLVWLTYAYYLSSIQ